MSKAAPRTPLPKVPARIPAIGCILNVNHLSIAAQAIILIAMSKCIGIPNGKPTVAAVNIWPKDITIAPSMYPHANTEKYPGQESIATVPVGLGIFIKAPTALKAMNIAIRATLLGVQKTFFSVRLSFLSVKFFPSFNFLNVEIYIIVLNEILFGNTRYCSTYFYGGPLLLIIAGSSSRLLALKVAKELGKQISRVEIKKFPDGEKYIRVMEDIHGEEIVVIQSMYHTPDEFLFEYFLLADTLKNLGAKKIILIAPYFAYARQDKCFNPGEAISLLSVAKLIESVGTNEVYTIDMHLHRFSEISKLFKIPSYNLSAFPVLAEYIQKNFELKNPVVIGPDEEAEQWAKTIAEKLRIEYNILEKRRLGPDKVEIKPKMLNLNNKDVIIVDDIISTGGTMVEAIKAVRREGAHKVIVACTHPILVENALIKIYESGADIVIGTDTIPSQISYVSVAPIIAKVLKNKGG